MTKNKNKILALFKTAIAFSHSDKTRTNIYGILLHSTQSELRIEATNGRILIEIRYIYQNDNPFTKDFQNGFIPKDKLDILIKLLSITYNPESIQESIEHDITTFPNTKNLYDYDSLITSMPYSTINNYYGLEVLSQAIKGISNLNKAFDNPKLHFTQKQKDAPLNIISQHQEVNGLEFVALLMYTRE